jgi:hypothetical protein
VTNPPRPPDGEPPQPGPPQPGPPPHGEPPYSQPQYSQPPYPPPPKSRRGLWIGFAIGGAVVLLLCCGAFGVLGFIGYQVAKSPEVAATSWLEHLQQGDYQSAYELLCRTERDAVGVDEFAGTFDGDEAVVDYTVDTGSARTADGRSEVDVQVTLAGGPPTVDGTLVLVSEDGDWKVCDTIGFR